MCKRGRRWLTRHGESLFFSVPCATNERIVIELQEPAVYGARQLVLEPRFLEVEGATLEGLWRAEGATFDGRPVEGTC